MPTLHQVQIDLKNPNLKILSPEAYVSVIENPKFKDRPIPVSIRDELVLEFVNAVREHPLIWNYEQLGFKQNFWKIRTAWRNVGFRLYETKGMIIGTKSLRTWWSRMLDSYTMVRKSRKSTDLQYTWQFYSSMQFMKTIVDEKIRATSISSTKKLGRPKNSDIEVEILEASSKINPKVSLPQEPVLEQPAPIPFPFYLPTSSPYSAGLLYSPKINLPLLPTPPSSLQFSCPNSYSTTSTIQSYPLPSQLPPAPFIDSSQCASISYYPLSSITCPTISTSAASLAPPLPIISSTPTVELTSWEKDTEFVIAEIKNALYQLRSDKVKRERLRNQILIQLWTKDA